METLNQRCEEVMGWMRANKLTLNPDKMQVLLVTPNSPLGNDFTPVLDEIAFPFSAHVCSLEVLLDLALLLEVQVLPHALCLTPGGIRCRHFGMVGVPKEYFCESL